MSKINLDQLDEMDSNVDHQEEKGRRKPPILNQTSSNEPKRTTKTDSFSLPMDLIKEIRNYCKENHMSKSTVAVLALKAYLKEQKKNQ